MSYELYVFHPEPDAVPIDTLERLAEREEASAADPVIVERNEVLAEQVAKAANVIGTDTGWQLYDPQLERFIDPARDADQFAEAFSLGVGHVTRIASEHPADTASDRRQSLWRRLLGRR